MSILVVTDSPSLYSHKYSSLDDKLCSSPPTKSSMVFYCWLLHPHLLLCSELQPHWATFCSSKSPSCSFLTKKASHSLLYTPSGPPLYCLIAARIQGYSSLSQHLSEWLLLLVLFFYICLGNSLINVELSFTFEWGHNLFFCHRKLSYQADFNWINKLVSE
jgi:hypothetical protein